MCMPRLRATCRGLLDSRHEHREVYSVPQDPIPISFTCPTLDYPDHQALLLLFTYYGFDGTLFRRAWGFLCGILVEMSTKCGAQGTRRRKRSFTDSLLTVAPVLEAVSQLEIDTAQPRNAEGHSTADASTWTVPWFRSLSRKDLDALSRRPPKTLMSRAELSTSQVVLHWAAKTSHS